MTLSDERERLADLTYGVRSVNDKWVIKTTVSDVIKIIVSTFVASVAGVNPVSAVGRKLKNTADRTNGTDGINTRQLDDLKRHIAAEFYKISILNFCIDQIISTLHTVKEDVAQRLLKYDDNEEMARQIHRLGNRRSEEMFNNWKSHYKRVNCQLN